MNSESQVASSVSIAAAKIREILTVEGVTAGTLTPTAESKIGEAVEVAVKAAGDNASTLFAVTTGLSALVPFGSCRLRELRTVFKRQSILEQAAVGLFGLLAGDPAADAVDIGCRIHEAIKHVGGPAFEEAVLDGLAAKLGVSSRTLAGYHDAFLVVEAAGFTQLGRHFPMGIPFPVLQQLARIIKTDDMPWRQKEMILLAAKEISKRGAAGNRAVRIVTHILASRSDVAIPSIVKPAWHLPLKTDRKAA